MTGFLTGVILGPWFSGRNLDDFAVFRMNLRPAKHSTDSFGAISTEARATITTVFTDVGYADHWISFGLSKVCFILDSYQQRKITTTRYHILSNFPPLVG